MKNVLWLTGGWDGHQPEKIVQLFSEALEEYGFKNESVTSLDVLADEAKLKTYAMIVPCWTMGSLTDEQSKSLQGAIKSGVGLGGIHGGMGDAFRGNLDFEWMVGGHFVGHPHVGDYTVRVKDVVSPIMQGIPSVFSYHSEQYYMMIDPSVQVLADTEYVYEGQSCDMPVVWVKKWGQGRVFYSALGHDPEEFTKFSAAKMLTVQGLRWAAGALG
ncbi:MAG: ThuA domain-containing protein [Blastochloris sp.]|jgi:type 1 glutamine amidotransferase|nr:ThuA domain-containing protein [Blastochloris sp.]